MKKNVFLCLAAAATIVIMSVVGVPTASARTHTVIKVGWYTVDGMQDTDAQGRQTGYDYEYLKAIARYTGWDYEFVSGSWKECLQMLYDGRIDILGGVAYDAQRDQKLIYGSIAAGAGGSRLVCRVDDTRFSYGDFSAIAGMRVGTVTDSTRATSFSKLCKDHDVAVIMTPLDDQQQMMSMLDDGQLDLALVAQARRLEGYRTIYDYDAQQFYFALRPGAEDLAGQLNEAMRQIMAGEPNFNSELSAKYFQSTTGTIPSFTTQELKYIQDHPDVIVAYDPAWTPIEYYDQQTGTMGGMMKDVFGLLADSTGLQFTFVTAASFSDAATAYHGQAQMFSSLSYDYSWGDKMGYLLTKPLYDMQVYQLRHDTQGGKIVALPEGYYIAQAVMERYVQQDYTYRFYPTVKDCVEAVHTGQADMTFLYSSEFNYYISIPRYSRMPFTAVLGFFQQISVAVSTDADPLLFSIINKAVSAIPQQQLGQIAAENSVFSHKPSITDLIYTDPLQFLAIAAIGIVLAAAVIFMLLRSRTAKNRNDALTALNAQLATANAAKSDFLSRMSHDIRTPMNVIIGMTDLASEQPGNPKETADYLGHIKSSGQFLLGLINDVLDMSAIENRTFTLSPTAYSLDEFFSQTETMFEPLCRQKGLHLQLMADAAVPQALCLDRLRFNQIFFNLLSNAVKFTPAGGTICLQAYCMGRDGDTAHMHFEVKDTGVGMSEEFMAHMFEPFAQEHSTDGTYESTGLGLAIVNNLVNLMGGRIGVTSQKDKGTIFTIEMDAPITAIGVQLPAAIDSQSIEKLKGRRVLLAEDHPLNARIATALLAKAGMQCTHVSDGQAAVDAFTSSRAYTYDAILMDIRMPVMDGQQATAAIRSSGRRDAKTIPIIALTANAYDDDIRKAMQSGMDAHVAKPIDANILFPTMARLIDRRHTDKGK